MFRSPCSKVELFSKFAEFEFVWCLERSNPGHALGTLGTGWLFCGAGYQKSWQRALLHAAFALKSAEVNILYYYVILSVVYCLPIWTATCFTPSHALRSSSDTCMLKVQQYKRKTHGFRTFSCFGPHIWNSLTLDTAQRCHFLKPNWKPSSSHSISILTSTQFLLQS